MKKLISILTVITISMTGLAYASTGNEKKIEIDKNIETNSKVIEDISIFKDSVDIDKKVPKELKNELEKTNEIEETPNQKSKKASEFQEEAFFEKEPNGTFDKANKIEVEDSVIGEFGVYPDLDYFKFTVTKSGEFYLLGNVSDSYYDPYLRVGLLDSDGKTVLSASNLINSNGSTYQVMQELLVPGDYYIVVYQDYTVAPVDQIYSTVYSFITDFETNEGEVSVEALSLDKPILMLNIGQSNTVVATVNPYNATNKDVVWTSSNNQVALVDKNGKVTAVGEGTATITATSVDGMISDSSVVTVKSTEENEGEYRVLESKTNVAVDKMWTVNFNLPIDKKTILEKNLYVSDKDGNIITMLYTQDKELDNTIYLMPTKDYKRGENYTLWIKELTGTKGQKLKKYVKMDFVITK